MENNSWLFSAIEIEIGGYYPSTFRLILWWTALAKAPFLNQECLKRLMKTAASVGYFPERNLAIVHAIYGTGMMLTEVAILPISSYLNRDGSVRASSKIPATTAYNCKERSLYWTSPKVINALDGYLSSRLERSHGTTGNASEYRGLDPHSPIFLTVDGIRYALTKRITQQGRSSYSCDTFSQFLRNLHLQAGIKNGSAMSGRRTFAVRLFERGCDLQYISELLGHETLKATKQLIGVPPISLRDIVAQVF